MALFKKNGFIRNQEVNFAYKLLTWKYEKSNSPLPPKETLRSQAEQVVDEAHRIAKDRGSNVMKIVKETIRDIQTGKKS